AGLCAGVLLAAGAKDGTASRTWVSNDGRPINGTYLRSNTDAVVIRGENGKELTIPLKFLSAADRDFVAAEAASRGAAAAPEEKVRQYLKYNLSDGSGKWPEDRRKRITDAMDSAVALYNKTGVFKKTLTANNSPGTPTADANYDGWINFGGSINTRVALHEIGHTLGIGTHPNWQANI